MGLLSYRAYWAEKIVELLINTSEDELSIDDIAQRTAFTHADILSTVSSLGMLKSYAGKHMIVLSDAVMAKYGKKKPRVRIDPTKIHWKPFVLTKFAQQKLSQW